MDPSLLSRYKDIKLKPSGTLFEPDLFLAKEKKVCPLCYNKLKQMKTRPLWFCNGKKHSRPFIISSEKML